MSWANIPCKSSSVENFILTKLRKYFKLFSKNLKLLKENQNRISTIFSGRILEKCHNEKGFRNLKL
ncbi:hypothetical protein BHF72_0668 [Cloacibacterium normanense]|uniref:Uncharacterized protein n=1 Tax=Cloacibacterium normanense TaxID=237258 RepID=A0A1E5UBJ6_9FLAO|nr:hypothetical protein BHF72_0668 [Cloacibacterium normanense]